MRHRWLSALCVVVLFGCESQPSVLFTATRDNATVLGLTDSREECEGGTHLAYLTNGSQTLRGCWVRTQGDIRASFGRMSEIKLPSWQFQATEIANYRNVALERFEESKLYAVRRAPTR